MVAPGRLAGGVSVLCHGCDYSLPDFRDQYARAREEQADHYFQEIIDIADNATPETVNVARLRVDSRKFAVARLAPKKYGDHVEHEHSGSSQHLVAVVNLLGAPDDASLPLPQKPAIK